MQPTPSLVRATPHRRIAELWVFALEREGIAAVVAPSGDVWVVMCDFEASERAKIVLEEIDAEDPESETTPGAPEAEEDDDERPAPRPLPLPGWGRSWAGATCGWLLLVFYGVTGAADPASRWFARGAADAEVVWREPWRAVTALTLHADMAHVLSNAAAILIFMTAASWRLGPGASVAVVLGASAVANLLSAGLYGSGVTSVGASTAAFAALGLLGALAITDPARRRGVWVVIAASLALLGFLGTSPGSDVLAHATGWGCGLALGLPFAMRWRTPPGRIAQGALAIASLALVAAAWSAAFAGAR